MTGALCHGTTALGQRHVVAVMAGICLAIGFSSRASLSILVVAMTTGSNKSETAKLDHPPTEGECVDEKLYINTTESTKEAKDLSVIVDMSREVQGLVLSAFYWGYLLLQIPGGNFAQRYGAKKILAGSMFLISVLNALVPLCVLTSNGLLIANLVVQGVVSSVSFPATYAMLGRWSPSSEASSLPTIAISGPYFGIIFGQVLGGAVSASSGWPTMFYVNCGMGIAWLLPWAFLVTDSPEKHPRISKAELNLITKDRHTNQKKANRRGIPWRRLLLSREALVYVPICFCHGWASYSLMTCLPQFLSDVLHLEIFANGAIASLPTVAQVVVANIATQIADRGIARGILSKIAFRKIFTTVGFWGYAASFLVITQVGCNRAVVIALVVIGDALLGIVYAGYFATPVDVSPEFSGTLFAIGNLFMTSGGIVAPIVADVMVADMSRASWMKVFGLGVGMSGLGGLLFLLLGSSRRRRWDLTAEEENRLAVNVNTAGADLKDDETGELTDMKTGAENC